MRKIKDIKILSWIVKIEARRKIKISSINGLYYVRIEYTREKK